MSWHRIHEKRKRRARAFKLEFDRVVELLNGLEEGSIESEEGQRAAQKACLALLNLAKRWAIYHERLHG